MENHSAQKIQPLVLSLSPSPDSVTVVTRAAEAYFDEAELPFAVSTKLCIAIDEIVSNIVNYSGASLLNVTIECQDNSACITFRDNGVQYDPTANAEPDITLDASERELGGLGVFMVRKIMDRFEYSCVNGENTLTIAKNF